MDFPINLNEKSYWVYSIDELKQNIEILLKNPVGTFLQSYNVGANFSVHSTMIVELEEGIRKTLEQIPLIVVNSVDVSGYPDVTVSITYNKEVVNFQYSINV